MKRGARLMPTAIVDTWRRARHESLGRWRIAGVSGKLRVMAAVHPKEASPIPSAPIGDLDLDIDQDEEEWERRVMALAANRIREARARLERLGIIHADGTLVSSELPPDMMPDSDTTLETG